MPTEKNDARPSRTRAAFTLIELLLFTAIFSLIIVGFITILITVVSIQARQSASSESEQQGQFLVQQLQFYIESARLVDLPVDTTTSTLTLRVSTSSNDPTTFTISTGTVYLRQGVSGTLQPLTSSKVAISNLLFTRHYNLNSTSSAFGTDSVSFSFTVAASSTQQNQYVQTFQYSASVLAPVPKIALIQQAKIENNAVTTSLTKAFATPNEKGDLLLAVVSNTGFTSTTVTDTNGNTWTALGSIFYTGYTQQTTLYQALNANAGANTTTVTFGSGSSNGSVYLYEYRGTATSSSFDAASAALVPATTSPSSGFAYPTSTVELLFGIDLNVAPISATVSAGTGYTLETSSTIGYNTQVAIEDMVQYVTTPVAATWQYGAAVTSTPTLVTFK